MPMPDEKLSFWKNIQVALALVSVLWIVQFAQYFGLFDFTHFANHPRHWDGLPGIIFSPFIHDPNNFEHIISNSLPFMVLFTTLISAYPRVAIPVLAFIHLTSGILVWLFAPADTYHIGISGIIYGIAAFLIASGIFRRDRTSVTIAILVTLVYGGSIWGFIPVEGVSWQSHLFGALSGAVIAYAVRRVDLPPPHEFELEENAEEGHFFDIERDQK
jgi:membrane associated rhomboid family serine protease